MTNHLPVQQGRHPMATQVRQQHHDWSHHLYGSTQGVHPETLAAPTTNVTVEIVNNFLDRVQSKCKDLAIYHTQIILITAADGDRHNLLVNYNDIKLSNVCQTVHNLHEVKEDLTETVIV
jgi:hypothetical protein